MSVWEGILLGIIQGATEFLPVSSSGHLVLGQSLLGANPPGIAFEVALHLGTLISVVVVYRERIFDLVQGMAAGSGKSWRYAGLLLLASVPAGIVGVLLKDQADILFESATIVGWSFLVTGVILWSTRVPLARPGERASPAAGSALAMGVAQAFAIVPGISRSGSTVATGLWLGVDPDEAAAFSFLMSVPAIIGAALIEAGEIQQGTAGTAPVMLGTIAAALTGVLAIKTFVAMLKQRSFHRFAYYLWPLGVLFLLYMGVWNGAS